MAMNKFFGLHNIVLTSWLLFLFISEGVAYKASVVEFESSSVTWDDINNDPFGYFEKNMEKLRIFVREAKGQGSDIIVFPEYGLQSLMVSNVSPDTAKKFSQILPTDLPQKDSLCDLDHVHYSQALLQNLSCVAHEHQIYMVVNLLTMLWNNDTKEFNHYNTNVVFDRNGSIISRYRKFNTYHEPVQTNELSEPDIAFFDADFGARIGLMTCFDILFDKPSKALIGEDVKVDAIVLTTAWGDELPFLTATAIHPGSARMLNTTIISSGHHYLKTGVTGSGIYSRERVLKYTWNESPKVLTVSCDTTEVFPPNEEDFNKSPKLNLEDLNGYNFIEIPPGEGSLRMYANGTNCTLDYSLNIENIPESSGYVFMGKKGDRTFGGSYKLGVQVCGIVFCENLEDKLTCGTPSSISLKETAFKFISIGGVFEKGTIPAPVSLNQNYRPLLEQELLPFDCSIDNLCIYSSKNTIKNLYSFGLYGRLY